MSLPPLPFSCLVTGTDTEIGKTLISAAILHIWASAGHRVIGMKPVAAGAHLQQGQWHNEDTDLLIQAGNVTAAYELHTPYLWQTPMAPHLAAGDTAPMKLDPIMHAYRHLSGLADSVVVEGVGGFRVPLSDTLDTADMAVALGLPVILVVGLRLGCMNHALLTAEAIQARGLPLAGWVANHTDPHMLSPEGNIDALRARLPADFLGYVPHLQAPTPALAATYLR